MINRSIKVLVGSRSEQPCVYVFDLTEFLYKKIQETRQKLKEFQGADPRRASAKWKPGAGNVYPYFLRSNIIRGIEKQERDISGLLPLAIHDKHFTRKVTEEFNISLRDKSFSYIEEEYKTDLLGYFMKDTSIVLRIVFFEDFIAFMSLEEPKNIQHVSYRITYEELDEAYYYLQHYYDTLEDDDDFLEY